MTATEAERNAFTQRLPELERIGREYSGTLPPALRDCPTPPVPSSARATAESVARAIEVSAYVAYYWPFLVLLPIIEKQLSTEVQPQAAGEMTASGLARPAVPFVQILDEYNPSAKLEALIAADLDNSSESGGALTIEVRILRMGLLPSDDKPSDKACLSFSADLALSKSTQTLWSDIWTNGPEVVSSDAVDVAGYCLPVERWQRREMVQRHLDILMTSMRNGLRQRLPGLPWKQLTLAASQTPEAVFGGVVWWFSRTGNAVDRSTGGRLVQGRIEIWKDHLVFLEPLSSGDEAPYSIKFSEVKRVALADESGSVPMIYLRRHDGSVERFAVGDVDSLTYDADRTRALLDIVARKLNEL